MKKVKDGYINKLFTVFSLKQRLGFLFITFLFFMGSVLETGTVALMLPFMNSIISSDYINQSKYLSGYSAFFGCYTLESQIALLAISIAILYLFKNIYMAFITWIEQFYLAQTEVKLSHELFEKVVYKPYVYHSKRSTAETQRLLTGDVNALFRLILNIFEVISETMTAFVLLVVLIAVNYKLTILASVIMGAILCLINKFVAKRVVKLGDTNRQQYVLLMNITYQIIGSLKSILTSQKQEYFIKQFTKEAKLTADSECSYNFISIIPRAIVETICMSGIFIALAVMILLGGDLLSVLPVMATFALASVRLIPVLNRINTSLNGIRFHEFGLNTIYDLLKDPLASTHQNVEINSFDKIEALTEGIRVNHISFKFSDSENLLFRDISLEIPAGKSVAFIGTTGSGKTTLADIILGLQEVNGGEVLVDGKNIKDNKIWWANQIGYIPQAVFLWDDTIKKNIAFGLEDNEISEDRIWKCLKEAQLYDYVKGLPEGLETKCGENGIRFSGGQKQRIGIARALYTQPAFLVLDEATSALDNDTENAIIEELNQLAGEKTILIIAHRLSSLKNCDNIYRIENGILEKTKI